MARKTECKRVYLGLGSNTGNRKKNIIKAVYLLSRAKKIRIIKLSTIYKSKPWGYLQQREFYNAVVKIKASLYPKELLDVCQRIEKKMGKRKRFKWGPRIIDIDILLYKNIRNYTKKLTIPHKYIIHRAFVLVPLAELDTSIRLNGQKLNYFIDRLNEKIKPIDN